MTTIRDATGGVIKKGGLTALRNSIHAVDSWHKNEDGGVVIEFFDGYCQPPRLRVIAIRPEHKLEKATVSSVQKIYPDSEI